MYMNSNQYMANEKDSTVHDFFIHTVSNTGKQDLWFQLKKIQTKKIHHPKTHQD